MIRENKTFAEMEVGDSASSRRICRENDLYIFAHASGNLNPMYLPEEDGDGDGETEAVVPSMWIAALVSAVLGNILPGPGTLYKSQSFEFLKWARVGDELAATVRVAEKHDGEVVVFDAEVTGENGEVYATGRATVVAPRRKLRFDSKNMPQLLLHRHQHFDRLLEACEGLDPLPTAVVAPEEAAALEGALLAAKHQLIEPILVGDARKIEAAARDVGRDIGELEIIDIADHRDAAMASVKLVHDGRASALMKGHLHTDVLLGQVVKRNKGLRTTRRLSHVYAFDVPGLDHVLLLSDAAINIAPDLQDKVDIVQNSIDFARSLGVDNPKVGVLSAVETVNPQIPSTLDAAVLSKMAERGQITGGLVDGPLAMDNAMDVEAARTKGITSLVAGHADVLIAPNLEAGNLLAKELVFVARANGAGIVVGAKVPIILTSRADDAHARLVSCAMAVLYKAWASGQPAGPSRKKATAHE